MEFIKQDVNIDFLGKRQAGLYFSLIVIGIGLISLLMRGGPNFGLDFTGGTEMELHFENPIEIGTIRTALNSVNLGNSEIKTFGSPNEIIITTDLLGELVNVSDMVLEVLQNEFSGNTISILSTESVGPRIGNELKNQAVIAIFLSLIFLIIFISWRFEFKFAIGAIAALVHDVLVTIGLFSLLNKEITLAIVAALLFIVGYSLNDTIVVSDRIRENLKLLRRENFHTVVNKSLNQTLSRTIITSVTTLMAVVIIFLLGSEIIKDFALALIIGVTIGTYSSIFVATPIVVSYHDQQESKKKMR